MKLRLTILFCLVAIVAWPQSDSVFITEFMAQNTATLRDEDGTWSDWIELFNSGTNDVNLAGWYLTDNVANLMKWRFPATNLPSHAFLVVFASGNNRLIPGRPLHTSFSLNANGEYLALVRTNGLTIASEFAPIYPPQSANVSFGLPMQGFQLLATMAVSLAPTPGTNNDQALSVPGPVVSDVLRSPLAPSDDDDIIVTARIAPLSAPVGTVTLTYRVMFDAEVNVPMGDDGAHRDADAGDGIYGARIPASVATNGQMVRWFIRALDTGAGVSRYPPFRSTNDSEEYLGTVIQDSALNHPAPVLHWFISPGDGAILDNGGTAVPCSLYWKGELYDNVRFARVRDDSQGFSKGSYNIDFNSDHHFLWTERESRVNDIHWVTTYPDKAHMRNMLAYGVYADAGPHSPYHFVVPVRVQSNANFYGTVHLVEQDDDNYLERIGRDKKGAYYEMHFDPSLPANAEKKTRLDEDKSDFIALISGLNSPTNLLYIYDNVDLSEAINFFAVMVVIANNDCCHKNFYLYRDSDGDGEWEMMPWDLDMSFGRNWTSGENYWDDRVYPNNGPFAGGTFPLATRLFGDPVTRAMYLRRVRTLQDKLLQTNGTPAGELHLEKQIDQWTAVLTPDALLDLEKWGTWGGGRANLFPGSATYTQYVRTLPAAAAELKTNYLRNRRTFVFGQKMGAADFPEAQPENPVVLFGAIEANPASGNQNQEYIQLINSNSFAVDISGWRLSGAVDHIFQGGVVIPRAGLNNTLYVVPDKKAFRQRAASPRGGQGLYVEGPYIGRLPAGGGTVFLYDARGHVVQTNRYNGNPSAPLLYLRVTEIMYHPPPPPRGASATPGDLEFIELMNVGPVVLDLTGVRLTNGVSFSFTGAAITNLNPGQRIVLVKNLNAFRSVYGGTVPVAGVFTGTLDNDGHAFLLEDAQGDTILYVFYDKNWYPVTDGAGFSLVIVNSNERPETWSSSTYWRPSSRQGGSPGAPDPPSGAVAPVLINEVLSNAETPFEDAVELYNPTGAEVDVSGWWLSDDLVTPKKFRIPDGTFVPAKGFLAFDEHNFNSDTDPGGQGFSLKSGGDEVYLFAGDASGNLLNYMHGFALGGADPNVTFGRYITSVGQEHFVAQTTNTMLAPNAGPRVGPVVISEIMFYPPEIASGGVLIDNTTEEYLELHNITDQPVPLYYTNVTATNTWLATNTWRLDKGVNFNFPTGFVMAPHGFVLLVKFDPRREFDTLARFRGRYSVPPGVPILGPYDQKLSNSGESLELRKPGRPSDAVVPYILVDRVDYSVSSPWPERPVIGGEWVSLHRLDDHLYGNDSTNWTLVGPSAGYPYVVGGTPPRFITQPENTIGVLNQSATFAVNVAGTPPFLYLWFFNGTNLLGANGPVLTLSNLQANQAGRYHCTIVNSSGAAGSSNATLTLVMPARILVQPQSLTLRGSSNPADYGNTTNTAIFTVQAEGTGSLRYQWRFNGMTIPGGTGSAFTIANAHLTNEGNYSVVITDSVSASSSAPARLSVLIPPTIVQAPLTQTVPAGGRLNLSVVIKGNPPPFGYQWRSNSLVLPLIVSEAKTNFFSISTATNASVTTYRVVITNAASQGNAVVATFSITTVADTDGDGLPDLMETALGLDLNNPADAAGDLDHDGLSNRDEYLAGTDPTNAASYLKVDRLTITGAVRIEFLAVSNRTYAVEAASELAGGQWSRVGEVVASATNRLVEVFDPMPPTLSTQRVYRLVTPRGP